MGMLPAAALTKAAAADANCLLSAVTLLVWIMVVGVWTMGVDTLLEEPMLEEVVMTLVVMGDTGREVSRA